MNKITFILTYFGQLDQLLRHLKFFRFMEGKYKDYFNVIFVNDGYADNDTFSYAIKTYKGALNIKAIVVEADMGFNSHGCRNLAMMQSDTRWNMMLDLDCYLPSELFPDLMSRKLNNKHLYCFHVNDNKDIKDNIGDYELLDNKKLIKHSCHPNIWLLTRRQFWSTGGYDLEFQGLRHGDAEFFLGLGWPDEPYEHVAFINESETAKYIQLQLPKRDEEYIGQNKKKLKNWPALVNWVRARNEDPHRKYSKQLINFPWHLE